MERFRLARRWWPLALCLAGVVAAEAWLYVGVTRHALAAWRAGAALPGEWGWASIFGWHALIAAAGAALARQPLAELRTAFTSEGVTRPGLFGTGAFVGWAEAESVFVAPGAGRPHTVRINARDRFVEINVLYYKDADALLALIEERMRAFAPASTACERRAPTRACPL